MVYHGVSWCIIVYHRVSSCTIVYHRVSSCIIVYNRVSSCIIMYHHVTSCISMYHHVSLCIIMYQHVSACISMYHHVSISFVHHGLVLIFSFKWLGLGGISHFQSQKLSQLHWPLAVPPNHHFGVTQHTTELRMVDCDRSFQ